MEGSACPRIGRSATVTSPSFETFVERDRLRGSAYRAANWIHVGVTQGRGKLDRKKKRALPVKDIFPYPLDPTFRELLRAKSPPEDERELSQPTPAPQLNSALEAPSP